MQKASGGARSARGGLFIGGRRSTVDSCAGELVAVATGHGRALHRVQSVRGGRLHPEEEREETRRGERRARVSSLIGALGAAMARANWGERREKKEGASSVPCCGRRGTSSGALGRPEVAGCGWKGAATVRGRTVARSRACVWPSWHCLCH